MNQLAVDAVLADVFQVPRIDGFLSREETGGCLRGAPRSRDGRHELVARVRAGEDGRGDPPHPAPDAQARRDAHRHRPRSGEQRLAPAAARARDALTRTQKKKEMPVPEQSMAERLQQMGARLTVDDGFHVPTTLDYFWTETNWFALVIPDRKITIQLYPFFQTNLDVCSAGVYIWDDTGDQWWNCRYAKNFWHLPFPRQPLYDLQLPNGLRYKTQESLQKLRHRLRLSRRRGRPPRRRLGGDRARQPRDVREPPRPARSHHRDPRAARRDDRDRRGRLPRSDLVTPIAVRAGRRALPVDGLHVGHVAHVR